MDFDYYWIVDKKQHDIHGPYSYDRFIEKCNQMGVELSFETPKKDED